MRMAASRKTTSAKRNNKTNNRKKTLAKTRAKAGVRGNKGRKSSAANKRRAAGTSAPAKRSSATSSHRKRAAKPQEKDPRGGLTAAGRKAFAKKAGAHLKPGVTKKASEMTPQDMRRKGSWAVRFYGRKKLPPLVDAKGRPTRHALSAHAWGEPVPKTQAAARRIAKKGERLLQRYRRSKSSRA
jgi:hypothetical protein